jgi:hypothetical protein
MHETEHNDIHTYTQLHTRTHTYIHTSARSALAEGLFTAFDREGKGSVSYEVLHLLPYIY